MRHGSAGSGLAVQDRTEKGSPGTTSDRAAGFVAADARVGIPRLPHLERVKKASGYVPAHFLARISWQSLRPAEDIAIAVDGRIAAVTRPFPTHGETWIDVMIDETLLDDGRNMVGVYAVRGSGSNTKLLLLGGDGARCRKSARSCYGWLTI